MKEDGAESYSRIGRWDILGERVEEVCGERAILWHVRKGLGPNKVSTGRIRASECSLIPLLDIARVLP